MKTKQYEDQKPVKLVWILFSASFLVAAFGWVQPTSGRRVSSPLGRQSTWPVWSICARKWLPCSATFPWIFGALVLLFLGFLGRNQMRRGKSVRVAIALPFGICLLLAGACFLALPFASGMTVVVLLTFGAGFSVIYPMAPSAMAYAVGAGQRPVVMATLGGVASIGAIISPTAVGIFMEQAGYRTAAEGTPETVEMIGNTDFRSESVADHRRRTARGSGNPLGSLLQPG